jgi:hypothetical protein
VASGSGLGLDVLHAPSVYAPSATLAAWVTSLASLASRGDTPPASTIPPSTPMVRSTTKLILSSLEEVLSTSWAAGVAYAGGLRRWLTPVAYAGEERRYPRPLL